MRGQDVRARFTAVIWGVLLKTRSDASLVVTKQAELTTRRPDISSMFAVTSATADDLEAKELMNAKDCKMQGHQTSKW